MFDGEMLACTCGVDRQVAGEGNAFDVDDIAMQLLEQVRCSSYNPALSPFVSPCQICRFWYEQKLKIRSLENVLSNHFAVYGSSLCQLCLRFDQLYIQHNSVQAIFMCMQYS